MKSIFSTQDAVQTGIETGILPTGAGEIIGATKAAAILAADYAIWEKRTETAIRKTKKFTNKQKLDLYFELDTALAKKDIRAIIKIGCVIKDD